MHIRVQILEVGHKCSLGGCDGRFEEMVSTGRAIELISTASAESRERKKTKRRKRTWETNRGVGADILSNTRSVADLTVELVLVDAVGSGRFADVAGAAGEHELVGNAVFLGVEQVGAALGISQQVFTLDGVGECSEALPFAAEAEVNLVRLLGVATSGRRRRTRGHRVGRIGIERLWMLVASVQRA